MALAQSAISDEHAFGTGDIDLLAINTIRTLAIDAVEKANSGHAGAPMAMAPVVYTLWQKFLRYDPAAPDWPNRDRFVLSCGHASMLLYAMLHLSGVKVPGKNESAVSLDDIKQFRQFDSRTPGHPERGLTVGVETTTGPLGAGCGNSVGMAIAGRWVGAHFNRPDATIFDYDVYTLCSDGDLMEGVSSEAASLAGTLGLANLCWIYDSNTISIEGHTDIAFTEDVARRFEAYGWQVLHVTDANDTEALTRALETFKATSGRPTIIVVNSIIGYGAPHKQNTHAAHSDALGTEEVKLTKRAYGWPEDATFLVPDGIYDRFAAGIGKRGAALRARWEEVHANYKKADTAAGADLDLFLAGKLPQGALAKLPSYPADAKGVATRDASGKVLNAIAEGCAWVMGGSADLAPSTKTKLTFESAGTFNDSTPGGRNMHFGVREHGMGAVVNGMALCNLRAYGSTFLVFSDYMRPPIRLAALMELPSLFIFSHDSIGVGEDGPTHQPVEQVMSLRLIPGLLTIRPGDANEVAAAYKVAMEQTHHPVALILSRQAMPTLDRSAYAPADGVARGGYILADAPDGKPKVILIGTGSELRLCVGAYEALKAEGIGARVVSLPCWELFEQQDTAYREAVLPRNITARVSVEQGTTLGWERYTGYSGARIGMHSFGASAPLKDLLVKFGFTPEKVLEAAHRQIAETEGA